MRNLILLTLSVVTLSGAITGCNGSRNVAATSPDATAELSGPASYEKNCQLCHGAKGAGVEGSGPALRKLGSRVPHEDIRHIIRNGRGKMPGYKTMSEAELAELIQHIRSF